MKKRKVDIFDLLFEEANKTQLPKSYKITMLAFVEDIPFMTVEAGAQILSSSQLRSKVGTGAFVTNIMTDEQREEIIHSAIEAFEKQIADRCKEVIAKDKSKA